MVKPARLMLLTVSCCLITLTRLSHSFIIPAYENNCLRLWRTPFLTKSDKNEGRGPPRRSRLEGNLRRPTSEEISIMDEMISKLADAPAYELPNAVRRAFRVVSSPQFFLRVAERADQATEADNEKLLALASNLVATLEAVVETTEEQLDERARELEDVVKAAADPDSGEFLVPLLPDRVAAMRRQIRSLSESSLDEVFLSTLDAWINKSHADGMDLMVGILQKVLQLYAGTQITRALARHPRAFEHADSVVHAFMIELIESDAEAWDAALRASPLPLVALVKEVHRCMELIVLQLDAGSMVQRVQAEYLRELIKRVESVQKMK